MNTLKIPIDSSRYAERNDTQLARWQIGVLNIHCKGQRAHRSIPSMRHNCIPRQLTLPVAPQLEQTIALTDRFVERFYETLKTMLKKTVADEGKDRDKLIPYLLFTFREVPQESTGYSRSEDHWMFSSAHGRQSNRADRMSSRSSCS